MFVELLLCSLLLADIVNGQHLETRKMVPDWIESQDVPVKTNYLRSQTASNATLYITTSTYDNSGCDGSPLSTESYLAGACQYTGGGQSIMYFADISCSYVEYKIYSDPYCTTVMNTYIASVGVQCDHVTDYVSYSYGESFYDKTTCSYDRPTVAADHVAVNYFLNNGGTVSCSDPPYTVTTYQLGICLHLNPGGRVSDIFQLDGHGNIVIGTYMTYECEGTPIYNSVALTTCNTGVYGGTNWAQATQYTAGPSTDSGGSNADNSNDDGINTNFLPLVYTLIAICGVVLILVLSVISFNVVEVTVYKSVEDK